MKIQRFFPLGIALGAFAFPAVSPAQREAPQPAGQADPAPAATPARAIPPQPPRKDTRSEAPRREAAQPSRGSEASPRREAAPGGGGTLGERPAAPAPSAPSKVVTAGEGADSSATPAADKDSPLLRPPANTLPGRTVDPADVGVIGVGGPAAGPAPQPPAGEGTTQGVARPDAGKSAPSVPAAQPAPAAPAAQPAAPAGGAKPAPAAGGPR